MTHPTVIPAPHEQQIPAAANLAKAVLLIGLLLLSFYATARAAAALAALPVAPWQVAPIQWAFVLAMAVWHGMLILGMGVLAHDAVHKVLFRSAFWNELWGGLLSALTLIPFYANRQFHLTHHASAHQPGLDPENDMHHRPFWFAGTIGSLVGLKLQYAIFLRNLRRVADARFRGRVMKDAAFVTVAAGFYFWLVPRLGMPLALTVLPMMLVFPVVFAWRALSDHYAIPAIERAAARRHEVLEVDDEAWHRDRERRAREVTGWVVLTHPWLEWLWSGVNYHEVHHKYPWLSHQYLKGVFEATRDRQPYLVVRGYWRSLFNLRRLRYYESPEAMRRFLTTSEW
jgi:fatty acid desaturase